MGSIKTSDVISVLKEEISNFDSKMLVEDVGTIIAMGDGIVTAVSYTHLDVYKRQGQLCCILQSPQVNFPNSPFRDNRIDCFAVEMCIRDSLRRHTPLNHLCFPYGILCGSPSYRFSMNRP